MHERINGVDILGGGVEAMLAATVFAQAFPADAMQLRVWTAAGADEAGARRGFSLIGPDALERLDRIGVSVADLIALPSTLPTLGVINRLVVGWSPTPYGGCGADWAGTGFHHHWLRAKRGGLPHPYFAFSPGYHAIKNNRFAPPDGRNAIGALQHGSGVAIDPVELAALLKQRLKGRVRFDKRPADAARGRDGRIGLQLADGAFASSEFVILARAVQSEASAAASRSAAPVEGSRSGCPVRRLDDESGVMHIPLRNGSLAFPIGPAGREPRERPPWAGNALALAAAAQPPAGAEPWGMSLLMYLLENVIELLPDSNHAAAETDEFNRLWRQEHEELAALGSVFTPAPTRRCQERRTLFEHRGFVPALESKLIAPDDWVREFFGLHITPRRYDPLSERLSDAQLKQELQRLGARVLQVVSQFPDFGRYLAAIDLASGRMEQPAP